MPLVVRDQHIDLNGPFKIIQHTELALRELLRRIIHGREEITTKIRHINKYKENKGDKEYEMKSERIFKKEEERLAMKR